MFPYYEDTTRAYTDDELEELKKDSHNDIINPYIRKNVATNYNTINEEKAIDKAINIIAKENSNLAKILNDKIEFEIITKDMTEKNYSRYDSRIKKIYIYQNSDENEVIHEVGHFIEDILLKNNYKYTRIKHSFINTSKIGIIERDGRKYYALKNAKFVDEYQGFINTNDINLAKDNLGKIKERYLTEIFSESFREYFEEPNELKRKIPDMYNLIKEILK